MPLASQRDRFTIPRDVAYLNAAYMGPLSKTVVAAGEAGVRLKAAPWTVQPADFFGPSERVRALAGKLYGASADDIAFVPSVSYGTAVAARNLPAAKGQEILFLEDQFPSHVYIWQRHAENSGARCRMVRRADATLANGATDWTGALLEAMSDRTAIVAIPNCHWTDGALIDLKAVSERVRALGAALVLDLTQSLGALPFDAGDIDPDFAVTGSYKWQLGPYTLGTLYAAPRHHQGRPLEENWIARAGSEDFAGLVDYQNDYQPGARRFDMGERSSFHLMPMLDAALEQVLDWGVAEIAETLGEKTSNLAREAHEQFGLTSVPAPYRAGHFLGLSFPDGPPPGLVENLKQRNVHVSVRGSSVRVTPHVYNDDEDVARLFEALSEMLAVA